MECRRIRELAEPYVSGQVPAETTQAIVAHLHRCPPCSTEIEGLRRLTASIRSAFLESTDLPPRPAFVTALHAQLHAAATPHRRVSPWRPRWLALAATLTLVVGGGLGLRGLWAWGFTAILQAAVDDHRFCVVAFTLTERPIPLEQAAQLYDDPVDRSLATVEPSQTVLGGGPVRIVERHSCVFQGRRFAHIVLQYKRAPVSLVVTPDQRQLRNLPGASLPADGSIVSLPPVDGFHIAAFRGPRHVVFVIAELDDDDVGDVARAMEASVSRALQGT